MKRIMFGILSAAVCGASVAALTAAAARPPLTEMPLTPEDLVAKMALAGWQKVSADEAQKYAAGYIGNTLTYDNPGAIGRGWYLPDGTYSEMRVELDNARGYWVVLGESVPWWVQKKGSEYQLCRSRTSYRPPPDAVWGTGQRTLMPGDSCEKRDQKAGDKWELLHGPRQYEKLAIVAGYGEPMAGAPMKPTDGSRDSVNDWGGPFATLGDAPVKNSAELAVMQAPDGWMNVPDATEVHRYMVDQYENSRYYDNNGSLARMWANRDGSFYQLRVEFDHARDKWLVTGDAGTWNLQAKNGELRWCKWRPNFVAPPMSAGRAGASAACSQNGRWYSRNEPPGWSSFTVPPSRNQPEGAGERIGMYPGREPMPNSRLAPTDGPWAVRHGLVDMSLSFASQ